MSKLLDVTYVSGKLLKISAVFYKNISTKVRLTKDTCVYCQHTALLQLLILKYIHQ